MHTQCRNRTTGWEEQEQKQRMNVSAQYSQVLHRQHGSAAHIAPEGLVWTLNNKAASFSLR